MPEYKTLIKESNGPNLKGLSGTDEEEKTD